MQKLRVDYKKAKGELRNMRDSNDNHIFINEKLNQALKKASDVATVLEGKLE